MAKSKPSSKVSIVRAEPVTTYYANHAGVSVSPWDITIQFGRIIPSVGDQPPTIEQGLLVYMSPLHTKAFLALMQQQLAVYENAYGSLALPAKGAAGIVEG